MTYLHGYLNLNPIGTQQTCPADHACAPTSTVTTGNMTRTEGGRTEENCVAVGAGLGTLAAVLILVLVGVVLGWVWSCHRCQRTFKKEER